MTASEQATIDALTIGGAVGVGAGGAAGVGVGGAGAGSGNTVRNTIEASISGNSTVTSTGGNVSLSALDSAQIKADGGGISVGVGAGGIAGVGASVGVGFASNLIQNDVRTTINQSDVTAAGNVAVIANESASIQAIAIAGAVAVGTGGAVGVGTAGAGAETDNTIQNSVEASIVGSQTDVNAGSVSVTATDSSNILASAGGIAAGVGLWWRCWSWRDGRRLDRGQRCCQHDSRPDRRRHRANIGRRRSVNATENAVVSGLAIGGAVTGSTGLLGVAATGAGADANNNLQSSVTADVRRASASARAM